MMGAPDLTLLIPEIFVLGLACVALLLDLFLSERNRFVTYALVQVGLIGAFYLTSMLLGKHGGTLFDGTLIVDDLALYLKLGIYLLMFVLFIYSRSYIAQRDIPRGDYYVLGLFSMLGMMVMVSSQHFLTLYLGLELLSLPIYALVAINRGQGAGTEAAMKYFVLGALASGMLLYGMSILYGVTGQLDLVGVAEGARQILATGADATGGSRLPLLLGLVFVVIGLAFKLGAVPFHMWLPDIYQAAPTSITALIGTAPKLAAFAMLIRLLDTSLGSLHGHWQQMLIILCVLSMAVGNITAIAQTNIKRMLAYSAIAHMGYFLLGIIAGTPQGYSASMFYILSYALTTLAGFGLLIALSRANADCETLDDIKGLARHRPWYALLMIFVMASMAGIPPFIGFWAKLEVIRAVLKVDLLWLAIAAVLFSVIGMFYYLRVIKACWFDEGEPNIALKVSPDLRITLSLNVLLLLGLGLMPATLMGLCLQIFGVSG